MFQATQAGIQSSEDNTNDQRVQNGEDEQRRISSYDDMFRRIKDATGVSETKVSF